MSSGQGRRRCTLEEEKDPNVIRDVINAMLDSDLFGHGQRDVKAVVCSYDDDDSLNVGSSDDVEFVLITHEWINVKISLYPTWDGAKKRFTKKFWASRMILSKNGLVKEYAGVRAFRTTLLRTCLTWLRDFYNAQQKNR